MKTVVITGSARGLGFEMAKVFRKNNLNIVISDLKEQNLKEAKKELERIEGKGTVEYCVCNVTYSEDIKTLKQMLSPKLNSKAELVYETNIVEIVKANASPLLLDELNGAVDKSIQYLTGIRPSPINDALANLISTLEKKVAEIDLEDMMGMVQKFVGMTDDFNIENIVNAYMNSDVHKKNLAEIIEFKDANQ